MDSTYEDEDCHGPDIVFYVMGRPFGAHRALLAARSPFFKKKFGADWKHRREVRLANPKLTFAALFSLVHFFYTDRLDVAVEDMEDLVRICKYCGCLGLQKVLEKEMVHQKYADYKSIKRVDDSQKRFIFQGSSLPECDRLPAALHTLLTLSLTNSGHRKHVEDKLRHSNTSSDSTKSSSQEVRCLLSLQVLLLRCSRLQCELTYLQSLLKYMTCKKRDILGSVILGVPSLTDIIAVNCSNL